MALWGTPKHIKLSEGDSARCGVRYLVATPHCNTRNALKNYRSEALSRAFRDLQAELDRWEIPIRILPGAEILSFDGKIHPVSYEETESYQVTEMFINSREQILRRLLQD